MNKQIRAWVIVNPSGRLLSWGISTSRKEVMLAAANGFLSANEFYSLGTDAKRWAKCYRLGLRVRRAVVTLDEEPRHD